MLLANLSLDGDRFFDRATPMRGQPRRLCTSSPLLSLFDLILRRRKLDQTTLAGAQRSCCSLFHFHRAVFWPDRTRSCPQPANAVFPRVIPPENLSIDPPPFRAGSSCRACPAEHSAFSRSFAGREVVARCTGVTSILGVRLDVSTVLS